MAGSWMSRAIQIALCLSWGILPAGAAEVADTIGLTTGPSSGVSVRMAEDLAGLIDDGTTRRLIPMTGRGGMAAIADLLDGRGASLAIVHLDVLEFARQQRLFPDLETKLSYVAKLNYVEFHLLARADIVAIADLAGQVVSVGARSGDTAVTAGQLFRLLKIAPVLGNDDPGVAIEKLRRGEIAAVAFAGGKPAPLLRLADTAGLHLVPVPLTREVVAAYVPSRLNAPDYPGLIPADTQIETIAIPTGLFAGPAAVPGGEEYRKLANLVDTFFTQFQTLLAPGHHGKWAEVNLSATIPGWQRFAPAEEWLKRNASVAAGQDLRAIFMKFLDERERSAGGPQLTREQKDALFDQFRRWQTGQSN